MAGKQIASGLYVAMDGSYGNAAGMTIIDDSAWTDEEFDWLDLVSDRERADLADAIDTWVKEGRPNLDFDPERISIDEVLLLKYRGY